MAEHKDIQQDGVHIPHFRKVCTYTDLANELVTAFDLDKIALVVDTGAYYRLDVVNPISWIKVADTPTELAQYLSTKVDKVSGSSLVQDTKVTSYDNHLSNTSNPHSVTASQTGAYSTSEADTLLLAKEDKSNKGVANGYAQLDSNAKLPNSIIPDSILGQLEYMGVWDFGTLPTATQKGQYWVASGSGNGYEVGDWAVYNGTSFDKVDNTDAVSSVAGRTGNVTLTKSDVGLNNVDNTSDLNKPISTATQTALNGKVSKVASTDNAIVRFNGTTGEVQNSTAILSDDGGLSLTTPELITNGTFDTDVSGWTAENCSLLIESNRLKVANTTTANGRAYQSFTTEIGKQYRLVFENIDGSHDGYVLIRRADNSTSISIPNGGYTTSGIFVNVFTALDTTTFINLRMNTNSNGAYAYFDNISVKEVPLTLNNLPAVATTSIGADNTLPRWDSSTGALQPSSVVIDDVGNVELTTEDKGVIMKSANGTRYRLTVDDNGNLETEAL